MAGPPPGAAAPPANTLASTVTAGDGRDKAAKSIRTTIRQWHLASTRNNQSLEDLAQLVNPAVRGWMNYYGRFYRSQCVRVLQHLNKVLAAWARRKYKRLRRRRRASAHWLGRIARRNPTLFVLWELGVLPEAGS